MCGIFGSIGGNEFQNRLLAVLNEPRGRQSAGFWADGLVYKVAGNVLEALATGKVPSRVLDSMVYLGHTRQATSGEVSLENCHPFTFGHITGAHNGVVFNWTQKQSEWAKDYPEVAAFQVDSQLIFWALDKLGIDGLKQLELYAGVWWVDDREPDKVYLWCFDGELHIGQSEGALLFSSEREHLKTAGCRNVKAIGHGTLATISISQRRIVERQRLHAVRTVVPNSYGYYGNGWYESGTFGEEAQDDYWCQGCQVLLTAQDVYAVKPTEDAPPHCTLCGQPVESLGGVADGNIGGGG